MSQKKCGIILSYMNTAINALMNIILVPFLIHTLGSGDYGVYKIIHSFSGYLLIMDLGIGTIVTRYVSLFKAKNEKENILKSVTTSTVVCFLLIIMVLIVGFILNESIPSVYGSTFTSEQINTAQTLFLLMLVNVVITLFSHLFTGYINAHEKFILTNGIGVLRLIIRLFVVFIIVKLTKSSVTIILIDLTINFMSLLIFMYYAFVSLNMRIKFRMFDKTLIAPYFLFSGAILFQSIVNRVNNSVDNIILGAMVSPEIVTMYSSGLTIYGLYVALPEAINHVFLPQATRMFGDKLPDDDGEKITAFIVRAGRFEAILCLAILGGFTAFGKGFIELWIGIENVNAWYVALLLMIPVTIPMCENLMVTILNATNKRMIRSVILAIMAAINIVLTIVLIPILGYLGAAIGTFLSLTLGHGIMLNIYYHKRFKLKVFSMFKRVYLRLLPCTAIACATTYFLTKWLGKISWIKVSVVGIIYICIYGALVYILYLNDYEKKTLRHMIHLK